MLLKTTREIIGIIWKIDNALFFSFAVQPQSCIHNLAIFINISHLKCGHSWIMLVILIDALDLNEYPSPQHPHDSVQDDPKLLDDGGSIPDCEISST